MSDHRTAGVPLGAYSDYRPGQRVMTVDGYPGRVTEVMEGPASNTILVVLDNGMGGGQYDDSMLTPLNERSSSVNRTAADDYPELGNILAERPDLAPVLSEGEYLGGGRRTAALTRTADYFLDTRESLALTEAASDLLTRANEALHRVRSESNIVPQNMFGVVVTEAAMIPAIPDSAIRDQFSQYPDSGPDGISYFKGEIDDHRWVDCLLYRKSGRLVGVLNHFPMDFPDAGERKGNVLVLVLPEDRRQGIGSELLREATSRWSIDLSQQDTTPGGRGLISSMGSKTADWSLFLPPKDNAPEGHSDAYSEGVAQAHAGGTREPQQPGDAAYMADFDMGWAHGVQGQPSNPELPLTDPSDLADDTLDPDKVAVKMAGVMDFLKGDSTPSKTWDGPGHNYSFDWCRFRKNSRCMLPKELNKAATDLAGYAVWVPEDRGYCPRVDWDAQKACPVGEPGPNVPGGFTDATVPWDDGGQRGGHPVQSVKTSDVVTEHVAAANDDSWAFHFHASWDQVRAKAKRIRSDGGVRVLASLEGDLTAQVHGDHHVYQTRISSVPGRFAVGSWECGCPWAAYSWGRTGPWKKFEGRMCSHALAVVYEAQSRGMFGKDITEDQVAPAWVPKGTDVKVPGDWDRDLGAYTSAKVDPFADVALMVASGVPIVVLQPLVLALAVKRGHFVASTGPLSGQVGGRVRSLIFEDGEIVDAATGVKIPGPILYPTYDPRAGLTASLKEAPMGAEHWAMTFEAQDHTAINAPGYCTHCHKIKRHIRLTHGAMPNGMMIGLCSDCEDEKNEQNEQPSAPSMPAAASRRSGFADAFTMSFEADLHDEPEAALPTTDGADEDDKMAQARQALLTAARRDLCPSCGATHQAGSFCNKCGRPIRHTQTSDDEPRLPPWRMGSTPAPEAIDPHAWLMDASGSSDGDVAANARAFLANSKTALKDFSAAERKHIIDEGEGTLAGNFDRLDLTGTHYEALERAQAAQSVNDSIF